MFFTLSGPGVPQDTTYPQQIADRWSDVPGPGVEPHVCGRNQCLHVDESHTPHLGNTCAGRRVFYVLHILF